MRETDLLQAIKETETYKNFPKFKQNIVGNHKNLTHLYDIYLQAKNFGISYLKQKPTLMASDVNLIAEVLINENKNND